MKTLTEIFDEVTSFKQKKRMVAKLKENDTFVVRTVLQANYKDQIKFGFPDGEPPFTKNEKKVVITDKQIAQLGNCIPSKRSNQVAREALFIKLLEQVNADDASLLCLMKDKKLQTKYPTLTVEVINEAIPNLI